MGSTGSPVVGLNGLCRHSPPGTLGRTGPACVLCRTVPVQPSQYAAQARFATESLADLLLNRPQL